MTSGHAHGVNREYQVQSRDMLVRRAHPERLDPYAGDGIDVPVMLGSNTRTFDVLLRAPTGRLIAAECKRTKDSVPMADVDLFAYHVELLRMETELEVAGVFFAKTGYQLGAVKVAPDTGIEVAVCAEQQQESVFALTFERYDAAREKRLRDGLVMINGGLSVSATLGAVLIRNDGGKEDLGML